jgi:hypothetical protein
VLTAGVVPSAVKLTKGLSAGDDDKQKYPAAQSPLSAVSPSIAQYLPAVHGVQAVEPDFAVSLLNVPIGQGVGLTEPRGQ